MKLLAIIPARGGSIGVPRKNLQPINGVPLVIHKARQVAKLRQVERLVISTDDPLIASVAVSHGFEVHHREPTAATADVTLAQVAALVAFELDWEHEIGVFQATCPTLSVATMQEAIDNFEGDFELSSQVTATEEHGNLADHVKYLRPMVNRQFRAEADEIYRATGGVSLVRNRAVLEQEGFIAAPHHMFQVSAEEGIDIDTPAELVVARALASRLRIQFVALVDEGFGSGHLRRCLALADEFAFHEVAISVVSSEGERWPTQLLPAWVLSEMEHAGFAPRVLEDPSYTILDTLGTAPIDLELASQVLSLEDRSGRWNCVNELYTTGNLWGPQYAVLRPEFLSLPIKDVSQTPCTLGVLVGGMDYHDVCERLVEPAITDISKRYPGKLDIIYFGNFTSVVEYMQACDILVCGRGRTMYEAAAVGVPTITIPQNHRETTHVAPPWAVNLDLWSMLTPRQVRQAIGGLCLDSQLRKDLTQLGRQSVDGHGAHRIRMLVEGGGLF